MRIHAGFALLVLLFGSTALAAEQLHVYRWSDLKSAGKLPAGEVMAACPGGKGECLMVHNPGSGPLTVTIMVIENPGVTLPAYSIQGRIRYEGIEGAGYLEMWSHFPGGGAYFSRTLAESGPMASLRGTSSWRDISLPFSAAGTQLRPEKLVINVVLPAKGKLWLAPLTLSQSPQ